MTEFRESGPSSRPQHLAQGDAPPDRIADRLGPPGDFSWNWPEGSQFIAPVSGTLQRRHHDRSRKVSAKFVKGQF
jgi:hypothetical protein